jgi:hypothetical protein
MEYAFAAGGRAASGEVVLEAAEYQGGHLDWPAFALASGSMGSRRAAGRDEVHSAIPAPATFRGMPAPRWWEFEDANLDVGAISAEPDDLARLVIVEFALVYGNDWFVIPVEARVGTLCLPQSLVVTDTFGVRTLVRHYTAVDGASSSWRMFMLQSRAGSTAHREALFLPPTVVGAIHGQPIEDVLFVRDEMANMAWGIERTVEGVANQPIRRQEMDRLRATAASAGSAAAAPDAPEALTYRLATDVPDYWVPLLPQQIGAGAIQLKRGALLRPDGARMSAAPLGRILAPSAVPLVIFEEEVPRTGLRVTRAFQYARWTDGSSHLWIARHKQAGRGEGSSGLRFDVAGAR